MAIDGFTVNGPALVYCGTGTNSALELLGYTRDGVDIRVTNHQGEVITDVFGPQLPATLQDFGQSAEIVAPLVAADSTVLAKLTSKGDRTTIGQLNTPGLILTAYAYRLVVVGQSAGPMVGWSFNNVNLSPGFNLKAATAYQPFTLTWKALPYAAYTVTSGKDTQMWTRANS